MSLLSRLKNWLLSEQPSDVPAEVPPVINEPPAVSIPTGVVAVQEPTQPAELPLSPFWLENEDALRDEGVIFGLSDSKADEKIGAIRNYFSHKTANLEKTVEYYSEKIGELNLFIEQKENRINELKDKGVTLENLEASAHHLPRTIAGFLLSVAMCVGNYFLIDESILTNFPRNHQFIALGVLLAGMFNLFTPKSLFHEQERKISWKNVLEEIGMPAAASIFVFVQVLETQSTARALALLLFSFFLFLFAGKLLLSNLTLLKNDAGQWISNLKLASDKSNKASDWENEVNQLKLEIDEKRVEKWKIIDELKAPEAELKRLNEKREMLIKLFESEFNLARSYREKLTNKEIKKILE
ncbi:hypothetical protein [Emticicia sp. 21SJ11W-3]|uniref:hypothetical protein n=1 Tax=Emticicia sp. 21SJ11W-3 TaxID=2916755 RepID=UPI0020A1DB00|nr:hypothetical protein [Emticicia sp. 21SJ11W-3]UTA67836.1 hypothetical protein MB380_19885 [Emticicia sp. 21SJ11W-3]